MVEVVRHFPPIDEDRRAIAAPIRVVTLLEDRAQIRRVARVALDAGVQRLVIPDVAPVLQDVSMQGAVQSGRATVADVRVRRAMRVRREDRPEAVRKLDEEARQIALRFRELAEERNGAERRRERLGEIAEKGVGEIPQDVAWGLVQHQAWRDTFEGLFKRARGLRERALSAYSEQARLLERLSQIAQERAALERPDARFVAWIEADLDVAEAGEIELLIEYVVPNAIWRPIHSVKLASSGTAVFHSSAAVWQATGEDWKDVSLCFSTARSSLGTEPPQLTDDLLTAQKRSERVRVETRNVAIQRAGQGAARPSEAPQPLAVDLPGVDDGGDVLVLKAAGPSSVPSDGRPNIIPLFTFESPAEVKLVLMPELDTKVFEKVILENRARFPLLAGPVELVRDRGVIGWTRVLFVAPGERFELGFGPDDEIRVRRDERQRTETSRVDKWRHTQNTVEHFISNLGAEAKMIEITERIPVSELEEVKVTLVEEETSAKPKVDDHGFVRWSLALPARGHGRVKLVWRLSVAPTVEGM
ncbi:MAG: mucoidy inhibitor MuiA family protein [Deltaproteobacteria bacterium]|nr:mucoidy inhibitor MuiA family protein [Deltaproteobacteria bacterium]